MNRLAAEQVRRNRARDGEWEVSADHRHHLTERIVSLATAAARRLCVLGAGNCNDIDLAVLRSVFAEVHLVDLDHSALLRGVDRQLGRAPAKVYLHGGFDITGVWDSLIEHAAHADGRQPTCDDLIIRATDSPVCGLPAPFDVVVSTGMLSQLVEAVVSTLPGEAPGYWDLLLAVRTGHLRLLARLAAPGGRGLLVTDFVSSASCADLAHAQETDLARLAERLAGEQNFFHGLNPIFLPSLFGSDAVLRQLIAEVRHRGYWLWRQRARTYAVLGIEFLRASTVVPGSGSGSL